MADSLKRITWAKDAQVQDRIDFYLFQKAISIMAQETPDADELAFSKDVYVGKVNLLACAKVVVSNATIGAVVDAGNAVSESDMEYVIATDQWHNMAVAAEAAND